MVFKTAYTKAVRIFRKLKLKEFKMATYTCKWCAYQSSSPNTVTSGTCHKAPHKQHELMNATEKLDKYICKYCGYTSSSPLTVVSGTCYKSPHPNRAHELLG